MLLQQQFVDGGKYIPVYKIRQKNRNYFRLISFVY